MHYQDMQGAQTEGNMQQICIFKSPRSISQVTMILQACDADYSILYMFSPHIFKTPEGEQKIYMTEAFPEGNMPSSSSIFIMLQTLNPMSTTGYSEPRPDLVCWPGPQL